MKRVVFLILFLVGCTRLQAVVLQNVISTQNRGEKQAVRKDVSAVYPNTQPQTLIESEYNPEKVKGEKVSSVYAFPNRAYYIYTGLDVSTLVNLPYPLKEAPINPASDILQIEFKPGSSYFFIKPIKQGLEGTETNLHVLCEQGFSILINNKVVSSKEANQQINFLDGIKEVENSKMNKEYYELSIKNLNETIEGKDKSLASLFFNQVNKFDIEDTIYFDQGFLCLRNISVISTDGGTTYFYNLELGKDSTFEFNKDDIVLEIQPFSNLVLSEQKGKKTIYSPSQITQYTSDIDKNRVTLSFSIVDSSQLFYSTIRFGKKLQFNSKVNLDLNKIPSTYFETNL